MSKPLVLIVDDEPDIRELLEITLSRMSLATLSAADLSGARTLLSKHAFNLCLTDMRLPDGDGIELVEEIAQKHTNLPVAVITAHGSVDSAVQALKAGAFDFVSKPVDLQVLRRLVQSALRLGGDDQTQTATQVHASNDDDSLMLGQSRAMRHLREMVRKLARSQAPVYISGESGTGKELAARMIHLLGPRADKGFVPVNCGAIPQELMESEFFGHKKGSFTGAVVDKPGLFQAANGGTLFLDEVADLPLHMQVKLLRAIQEKSVRAVGGQRETPVDVRIISATHKDLAKMVVEGQFRQDLFYRLNVIELNIPPLRQRREDIPVLVEHILSRLAQRSGTPQQSITPHALETLIQYPFPGNIRELENLLERAVTLCEDQEISEHDLILPDVNLVSKPEVTSPTPPRSASPHSPETTLGFEERIEEYERGLILEALEETRWNRTAAAKRLGISFRALRYRLSKLGID